MTTSKVPRSRTVLMLNASEIPELADWNWDEILPPENDPFYDSFDNQVQSLRNSTTIRIKDLCKLMKISTATFYILYPLNPLQNMPNVQESRGRPTVVSPDDEIALLTYIEECQMACNCIKPKQAREWLENHILINKGKKVTLDRYWFHRFRDRHSDKLKVIKVHSRENERCKVSSNDINLYFNNLINALSNATCFSLVINMDESGFSSRPMKDSCQNCCYISECSVPPTFREIKDSSHISIVGAVTLNGKPLKPMLLSVNKYPPMDIRDTWLEEQFVWEQTPKGYMNENSMKTWLEKILIPYINKERLRIQNNNMPALLIFDGLKAHLTTAITAILNQNNILIVCLPPHSSHILQVLDLSIFGPMKLYYRNIKPQLFHGQERKIAKKVEKIIRAFFNATYMGNIFAGWSESGLTLNFQNGNIVNVSINRAKVLAKLGS